MMNLFFVRFLVVCWFVLNTAIGLAADRPNILLIVADDVGDSDLACYGGEIDTPSLDRLASDGIRFIEFHVNPMCVVTRTSLMTGHEHSQPDGYRRSIPIAKLMRDAGCATSIAGKWHQPVCTAAMLLPTKRFSGSTTHEQTGSRSFRTSLSMLLTVRFMHRARTTVLTGIDFVPAASNRRSQSRYTDTLQSSPIFRAG